MVSLAVVIRGVALMIPVLLLGFLFSMHSVDYAPDALKEWADAEIRGAGLAGILLFIAAGAAFTAIGLSRQVFALVGGYVAYTVANGLTPRRCRTALSEPGTQDRPVPERASLLHDSRRAAVPGKQ